VKLTVTDGKGATAFIIHDVTVTAPPVNLPPKAAFTSSCTDLTCSFTNTSTDDDGTIDSYEWDFGDGTATSAAPEPSHTYASAGSFTVTLKVTDNGGKTDTKTDTVNPTEPASPVGGP
jgi:PKD repeat protein